MAECVVCLCTVLLFLVLCVFKLDLAVATDVSHLKPAADFSKHTLIKPKIYHGREKRQISTTRETGDTHTADLIVTVQLNGEEQILDLRLNRDLLPKGYFRRYQKDGKHVVDRPTIDNVELCQYQGVIRNVPGSWAALSTCRKGLSGTIFDGSELHYIEKATNDDNQQLDAHHFVYKHSDLIETNKTCGYDDQHEQQHNFNRILRYKRASEPLIRGPYNANKRSRYVELVLVVDNREYKDMNENLSKVYKHCKEIANIINGLYSSLNIFIALVGVVVWTEHDEIDLSTSGDKTLTNFLHYRREKLIKEHPNDNAQLLTKFVFNKGVVGKALKGPICTFEYSGGVSMDHSTVVSLVATTVAHEMGHNFGMEHDTNECQCPEERCIMAPSSSSLWPTHWSSCSLEYLAFAFEHGMDYCLRNKPAALFDSPVCGNGFVEPGEQCDCGLPHTCDNTCCNATTCMLYTNATCATGKCCDLNTCRPKSAGSLCRAADYECDLPEYCTGQSEYCPVDIYKMDTEMCDGGKAFCYQGSCRTRSDQCKLLWGNTGKSSDDQCYNMNTKGSRHGNCGYHRVNQSYIRCDDENVLCGMLHCRHLNERLEFGMESVAILSQSFINHKGSIIPCRTAIVDLGINEVDPGLAPDGAKCGEGKMCVNQKCMEVANLRAMINKCPQDCNGNGVCNSMGHCHCKDGFAPPFCDYPGPGGSEDSGPASDPNARKEFVMAMYIVFLGIIPVIAVVAFLMFYTKHNVNFKWQKSGPAASPSKPRAPIAFPPEPAVRSDDNSSLLLQDHHTANHSGFQSEFFGQFKGFKLTPAMKSPEIKPQRTAPPIPTVPIIVKSPVVVRTAPAVAADKSASLANAILNANHVSAAPALPPPNPGSNSRPLISSPILETSTCTAKELMSPLRSAPKLPTKSDDPITEKNRRPLSTPNVHANLIINLPEEQPVQLKPKESGSTLNRIASFLKRDDKTKSTTTTTTTATSSDSSLPKNNNVKANKMDKKALRTIEISGPIPQNEIEISVSTVPVDDKKAVVMRAQSLRDSAVTPRPNIPNFGSMRQPNFKRPTSIPVGNRPKSPPPPRPPPPDANAANRMMKQPKIDEYQYDDCMNETPLAKINEETPSPPDNSDNIYAVIEETAVPPKTLDNVKSNSGSSESVGLLGEIVSEIQNRNFDSIYSTSTLARKQKENLKKKANEANEQRDDNNKSLPIPTQNGEDDNETYMNASIIYKSPESVYSNMGQLKSSASSTASGYIHPSAVNGPKIINTVTAISSASSDAKTTNVPPKTVLSTFKSDPKDETTKTYKPFASSLQRNAGPFASSFKTNTTTVGIKKSESPTSPTNKAAKPLNRQITPPNLRTRKPSPTRTVPSSPKQHQQQRTTTNNSNSPDLVISCSNTSNTKSPDVLNSSAKMNATKPQPAPKTITKPVVKSGDRRPPVNNNTKLERKAASDSKVITTAAPGASRLAQKQTSNVASLQQKFESKPPVVASKTTIAKKK